MRALYRRAYAWAYWKVLKASQPVRNDVQRNGMRFNEGPLVIRIMANVDVGDGGNGQAQGGQAQAGQAQAGQDANNAAGAAGAEDAEDDPDVAAVQAAEQLIEINATSLGRKVGGALLIPAMSSMMGSILLRLSKRSYLLRMFLGIRQDRGGHNERSWVSSLLVGDYSGPGSDDSISGRTFSSSSSYPEPPLSWSRLLSSSYSSFDDVKPWKSMPRVQQVKTGLQLVLNAFLGGSRMWVDSDPVWYVTFPCSVRFSNFNIFSQVEELCGFRYFRSGMFLIVIFK